jgi:hypothetical protein
VKRRERPSGLRDKVSTVTELGEGGSTSVEPLFLVLSSTRKSCS